MWGCSAHDSEWSKLHVEADGKVVACFYGIVKGFVTDVTEAAYLAETAEEGDMMSME